MDLYLHTIIYQIIADLENASVHYIIYARYFFFGQQMYCYEPVHINRNSVKDISLHPDSLGCRMMLDAGNSEDAFSIVIPFDFIGKISRIFKAADEIEQTVFRKGKSLETDSLPAF